MVILAALFLALGMFGLYTAQYGAAAISFVLVPAVIYGCKELDKRDTEYYSSPDSAKQPVDTQQALSRSHSESSRTTF